MIGDNCVIHCVVDSKEIHCVVDAKNLLLLDEDCVEELSVKTLADMFDYRIGDLPAKPPRNKNSVHKLVDAKIDTIARKLTTTNAGDYSEC